jgi:alpha-beta hydrolase superfamily lysophospholipase
VSVPVIRRTESSIAGSGRVALATRSWAPAEPERALLVVHGWAEHCGRYEHLGTWFATHGCAVHAFDHRGHGRSEGRRGHADRFDDLLDDVEIMLDRVRGEHPGLPLFVVGHSMGGLVVAAFARERQPEVAGIVTSGAALAVSEVPSRPRLALLRALRRFAPRLTMARLVPPEGLSRDPEVARAYTGDPLVLRRMSLALGSELLDAVERTRAGAAEVRTPMLLLHGAEDPICPPEGSRGFFAQLTAPDSDLRIYPELRHEIFNEPEHAAVFADVLEWMSKRERSGAGPLRGPDPG